MVRTTEADGEERTQSREEGRATQDGTFITVDPGHAPARSLGAYRH